MLNVIRRWLFNRNRAIFRYWDGRKLRRIDPMVVYRRLDSHPDFDWETTPVEVDAPSDAIAGPALAATAEAVREAFEIPVYDGKRGLTEGELTNLLIDYVEWLNALKKNTSEPPTSPPPTERESSPESTTKPAAVSG